MEGKKVLGHYFNKGKFTTPMNSIPNMKAFTDAESWAYGRMPEYLWIGLILQTFGRDSGLSKLSYIVNKLHELAPGLDTLRISQIIKLDDSIQKQFYDYMIFMGVKQAVAPLTVVLTTSYAPVFTEKFFSKELDIKERCSKLDNAMHKIMGHQSHDATDIRFVALYFYMLAGRMHMQKKEIDLLMKYPYTHHDQEIMKMVRPMIRSTESMILMNADLDDEYVGTFWECISEMTDCKLYLIQYPEDNRDIDGYLEKLHNIFEYLLNLFVSTSPLDEKMNVLFGIATYSYKRFKELCEHHLFNSISGRGCVRVMIENYIMMKYLVQNEGAHDNIWRDFELYGLGQYKLILERYRETETTEETHFDSLYIEALVNEFTNEEFIDMDTKYFDSLNIRLKAESVGEKSLYGLYYDYDSAFEHGLWGAIRESSLLKCDNPAHKYHCVPDINNEIKLKSVLPDCIMMMKKMLIFLDELYGIPGTVLNEVINFEIQPFA